LTDATAGDGPGAAADGAPSAADGAPSAADGAPAAAAGRDPASVAPDETGAAGDAAPSVTAGDGAVIEPAAAVGAVQAPAAPRSLVSDGLRLEWHLARPPGSVARGGVRAGLVIAHGLPIGDRAAANAAVTFPELADRVARDTGWLALSFSFRGAGRSQGGFSPSGWLRDLAAAVEFIRPDVASVFIAGFGFGGALALRVAAQDPAIGGVAAVATPSDLLEAASDVDHLVARAASSGYLPAGEPEDADRWAEDLESIDPLGSAAAIPPRPLLIVHGSHDPDVGLVDARALSDAALGRAELRIVPMAGHRLRHDPRAVALLLGWLQRHG
jgi:alpha/beta superfamily hydrolase